MSRATVEEAAHGFRGGHCGDEVNLNISALPTDLILKIFLCFDGKTIDTGKVCARYSIDGRSSSLITWDPFGFWRSVIADPGFEGYHFNHREEWSAYAFLSMVGCDDYKILSLTKRNLATPGYDVQMYLSSARQWSPAARTLQMIDRLSSGYAVTSNCVFLGQ
ncbi:hypothetical protein AHAS_Ahas15G0057200 [Arachis hypogaea]